MPEYKNQTPTVPMFRIENPTLPSRREPDGVVSHEGLVGQWFSPNLASTFPYLRKATQSFGMGGGPAEGAQLVIAKVPREAVAGHHVSEHPIAKTMDVEGDNYVIGRDGSYPEVIIPLDTALGGLVGHLGDVRKLQAASAIVTYLAQSHLS